MMMVLTIAAIFSLGAWLLMQRQLLQGLLGVCVLGHGANLLIVVLGVGTSAVPALIPAEQDTIVQAHSDPLPQALVLTAIVIGFGIVAFGLALAGRSFHEHGSDDLDELGRSDSLDYDTARH